MAEIGIMSEQKRLGVAWGTTFAVIFSAVVAGNTFNSKQQPEADAVLAAHQDFQESVATTTVEEKTTSLKPLVEAADEMPELEEMVTAPTQEVDVSEAPIEEEVGEVSEPFLITPVEHETNDNSLNNTDLVEEESRPDAPVEKVAEEAVQQELEVPETEAITSELTEEVEVVEEVELAAIESSDSPPVAELVSTETEEPVHAAVLANAVEGVKLTAIESSDSPPAAELATIETEEAVDAELADATEEVGLAATIEIPTSDVLADVPAVEAEPVVESSAEEVPAASTVAPPVAAIPPNEPDQAALSEASSSDVTDRPTLPTIVDAKKSQAKPFFGVGMRNPANNVITTIYAGSTAQSLGVKLGDRLVSINGQPVFSVATLRSALKEFDVDDPASVEIDRGGTKYQLGPKPLGTR